ncbi:MAG: HAD family hydrolase [Pseudomonadota bacterium]
MQATDSRHPAIDAILFDKDGTLLDFNATWVRVYEHAAAHVAARLDRPELAGSMLAATGMDPATGQIAPESALACAANDEIAAIWARTAGLAQPAALTAELEALFGAVEVRRAAPVAGLAATLVRLREAGYRLGVATMDSVDMAEADLDLMGVRADFDFVCGADSGFGYKPQAGMVQGFCNAVGVSPRAVCMVGDTTHDLRMGRNASAGMVVGVLTGAGDLASLEPLADAVLAGIAELPDWLVSIRATR